jgi:hypothetical protein
MHGEGGELRRGRWGLRHLISPAAIDDRARREAMAACKSTAKAR